MVDAAVPEVGAPDPVELGPARLVSAHPSVLGESPLWHPLRRQLFWVDIGAQQLLALDIEDLQLVERGPDVAVSAGGASTGAASTGAASAGPASSASGAIGAEHEHDGPGWHPGDPMHHASEIVRNAGQQAPQRWPLPESPGCTGLVTEQGSDRIDADRLVIAMRSGFFVIDLRDETLVRLSPPLFDGSVLRFNDGKVDPQGRFVAGSIYEPRGRKLAGLYRLCEDGRVEVLGGPDAPDEEARGWAVTTSNGLAYSPDGRTMYQSDTPAHTVYAFDHDPATGRLSNRRAFWSTPSDKSAPDYGGRPDGAAVDVDGCYWSAQYEGGRVLKFSPQGELLARIHLPLKCPTMVCFGGDDLRTLFITSARAGRSEQEITQMPLSGMLFALRVDRPGLPATPFVFR